MSRKKHKSILVISDTHAPCMHPDTVPFLTAVKKKYRPDTVVHIGDECFDRQAEVLTPTGWCAIAELPDGEAVLQVDENGGEFVVPSRKVVKPFNGFLIKHTVGNYHSLTTPKHDRIVINKEGKWCKQKADDFSNKHYTIPRHTVHNGPGLPISDILLRTFVMFSADFSFTKDGSIKGSFKKDRKITRCRALLQEAQFDYTESVQPARPDYTAFYISGAKNELSFFSKEFPHAWIGSLSQGQSNTILDECFKWDGYEDPTRNRRIYCSSLKTNIEFIQTLAHLSGKEATIRSVCSKFGDSYQVSVLDGKICTRNKTEVSYIPYNDNVYCVTVPRGKILVKQNNSIHISSNCDNHAISFHDSDPDNPSPSDELSLAIDSLRPLYKLFPKMDILHSNHGSLVLRRGRASGLSERFFKSEGEILEAPKGWVWHQEVNLKLPNGQLVHFHHGRSKNGLRYTQEMGCNTVQGHYHTVYGINYTSSPTQLTWSMQVGCLFDDSHRAFRYNKLQKGRPIIGCGIIIDSLPKLIPMPLDKKGRWTKYVP